VRDSDCERIVKIGQYLIKLFIIRRLKCWHFFPTLHV